MTWNSIEERRAYNRANYAKNRERSLAKAHENLNKRLAAMTDEEREAYRQHIRDLHHKSYAKNKEKYKKMYKTEEYRVKRRDAYARKHADDPMTEHRKVCIAAQKRRLERMTLEACKAKNAALKDMKQQ